VNSLVLNLLIVLSIAEIIVRWDLVDLLVVVSGILLVLVKVESATTTGWRRKVKT